MVQCRAAKRRVGQHRDGWVPLVPVRLAAGQVRRWLAPQAHGLDGRSRRLACWPRRPGRKTIVLLSSLGLLARPGLGIHRL
jgi:hypothetical protein